MPPLTDRPAPEQEPSARERFFEALLRSAVDHAIIAMDLGGLVTVWNEGAQRLLGWTEAEMIGQPAHLFFTQEDQDRGAPQAELQAALLAGRGVDERWHRRRDGSRFWGSGEMVPLKDQAGIVQGFIKIVRDRTAQRLADEQHRADAEFLRSVLAASGDCIKVLDLDSNLVFMSEGGQRIMEVSDFNQIRGCPWPDLWPDRGLDARAAVEAAKAGGLGHFQGTAPTMAGSPRWWDVQVTPILGADGRPERLLSVSRDVSVGRQAEIALREAQALNTLILNSSRDCIVVLDLDGVAEFVSPGGIESMEITEPGELLGRSWLTLWKDADHATAADALAEARAGGTGRFEGFCATYRGTLKWWDVVVWPLPGADGRPERLVAVGRDITRRRQAERDLRELNDGLEQRVEERARAVRLAEARFRGIFDSTTQLIGLIALDGTVLEANRAALALDAAVAPDGQGIPIWESAWFRRLPGPAEQFRNAFSEALSGSLARVELDLRLPGDRDRIYDLSLNPVRDDRGRIEFIVVEGRDISQFRATEAQLRQAQKMEAVGQLTGGLAHDFNNLLTGITGSLELLKTRLAQGRVGELDRHATAALGAAGRAAALTHRLLAFSRRQTLDPKPIGANALVVEMGELIQRTVGPQISLGTVLPSELWPTLCDPNQLENALLNLCINARDAMPDGGRLTIETANAVLDEHDAPAHDLPSGDYVVICVTDTGSGMAPEVMARAFDPFFTTKPIGMGTGLGLSMIYGFATQSGGQVRIASASGEGSTVSIYLPRFQGEALQQPTAAGLAAHPGADQTVLVVDDEPTVRMLITEVLQELRYATLEAADGAHGLRLLQSAARVDLLITDVGLPGGLNGRQMADAARRSRPELKVLFITGYAENALVGHGQLEPGLHVLAKPFAMQTLASKIRSVLATDRPPRDA